MRIVRHPLAATADTALAIGSFDGVHRGHAALLERLREAARRERLEPAVLTFEPLPQDDPKQRCPDISKAKRLLKWEPKVGLDEGLRLTLEFFRKQAAAS